MSIGERASVTSDFARFKCWTSRIVPTDEDYYWGVSSSVPVSGAPVRYMQYSVSSDCATEIYTQIKLREGRTDPSNHWTIKLVTASSHSGGPSSASLSDVASKSFDYIIVGEPFSPHAWQVVC